MLPGNKFSNSRSYGIGLSNDFLINPCMNIYRRLPKESVTRLCILEMRLENKTTYFVSSFYFSFFPLFYHRQVDRFQMLTSKMSNASVTKFICYTVSHCANDSVTLGMDGEEQSNTYCGCKLPAKRLYGREKVVVTFNSSQAANQAGFLLHYRAVGKKCVKSLRGITNCMYEILMVMADSVR